MDTIDNGRQALFESVLMPHIAAFGQVAMQRVTAALAVYLGTHAPIDPDPRQRPKFLWVPGLPPTPFYAPERFEWYRILEAATGSIRAELQQVLHDQDELTPFLQVANKAEEDEYLGGDREGRAWDAFFFYRHGQSFPDNLARCPQTAAALAQVPLTQVAGHAPEVLFSVLAPNTHIKPHHGVTNTRVVTHLPLIIPQGDCKLVVGGVEHAWQQGRCITFDDTFLHEAWNRTAEQRVVMILDTWNPDLTDAECMALRDLVGKIGQFNTAAGIN
jgi:aspartyl/asparaginyl beta-hydroxylase (cupin superfamily)